MIKKILIALSLFCALPLMAQKQGEWSLTWHDEFDLDGVPDSTVWNYEQGFVRNYEWQWYAKENVYQRDGHLVIEARPADFACPTYKEGSNHWRNNRKRVQWTSGSIQTRHGMSFLYGRLEVRARIPVCKGAWPAIWLLGNTLPWPANGEIDMMEYYLVKDTPTILANACWGANKDEEPNWDSSYTPLTHFTERDPMWAERFHTWLMDWNEERILLYLDGELLNEIDLTKTINGSAVGKGINPFHRPQYVLLNLALDTRAKQYDPADFPMRYEIDYVRLYQQKNTVKTK